MQKRSLFSAHPKAKNLRIMYHPYLYPPPQKFRFYGSIVLLLAFQAISFSQADTSSESNSVKVFGLPLVFFSNDTRWGFGAAGIVTFPQKPIASTLTFSFAYTQREQWLCWIPFQWFGRQDRWRAYGEIGWYRYLYQYFGIGNDYPNNFLQTYTAQFPRLRATLVRRLAPRQLMGLRYGLDDYGIVSSSPGSEIAAGILKGSDGGFSSGIGPVWLYDSRDNPFFPRRGWLVEASVFGENAVFFSDFRYTRLSLDAARYWRWGRQSVFAAQWVANFTLGDAPFFLLPQLGGTKRLRGYPDGKFRDRHLLLIQTEARFPLFWRLKGVVFAAAGGVFGTPSERPVLRPQGGAGLRVEIDRKQEIHLRLDYGVGKGRGNSGFYLTFGEAF